MITKADVRAARDRTAGRVRRTPVVDAEVAGIPVKLKLELLQHTGSFKPRGALNRVLSEPSIPDTGLIAASGGNHGLAVAYVAHTLGLRAEVFVPEVTPMVKRERIASMGADVVVRGSYYQEAWEAMVDRQRETGALDVAAYDHPATVAGQGTMAIEITEQVPDLGTLVMAVGGGGFIGGAAAWVAGEADIVAVEPEGAPTLHAALEAGHPVEVELDSIAADSLGARMVGAVPFETIRPAITSSILVADTAIRKAQRWLWDEFRLVAEPGGATALAGLLSCRVRPRRPGSTVVVVCGANTDPRTLQID